jgi:hypothetical protein
VDHEPTGEILKTPCIYCPHEVSYIIDFSRSVTSPEKRVAWKAAFLKTQEKSAAAEVVAAPGPTAVKKPVRPQSTSQSTKTDVNLGRTEWL